MNELDDNDKEKIHYKEYRGGLGNVNPKNEEIVYKEFKAGSGNVSPRSLLKKSQEFQPMNILNPSGIIPKCFTPNSLNQNQKNKILDKCKKTTFYNYDSQPNNIGIIPTHIRPNLFVFQKKNMPNSNHISNYYKKYFENLYPRVESYENEEKEDDNIIPDETQKLTKNTYTSFPLNLEKSSKIEELLSEDVNLNVNNSDIQMIENQGQSSSQSQEERLLLYEKLRDLLNLKKTNILEDSFIPTRENIIAIDNEFKKLEGDKHFNKIVNRWLRRNTNFKNVSEMSEKIIDKTFNKELGDFLNSKKNLILKGKFIPSKENILKECSRFKKYDTGRNISDFTYYWLKSNTPFKNITEIREKYDQDQKLFKNLKEFLNSKKFEIINGEFIPTQNNIIAEDNVFKQIENKNEFSHRISRWIKKNTSFENIGDLEAKLTEVGELKKKLRTLLDSLKREVLSGNFIPTEENLIALNKEFEKINTDRTIYDIVRWWLQSNTPFKNITEIQETFLEKKPSTKITEILDSKKDEILTGQFIPNKLNLRKNYPELGDYESSRKVIARWLEENSDGQHKNISDLIDFYRDMLSPEDLGHREPSEYTLRFFQEAIRVQNAWAQVVRKIDNDRLLQINQKNPLKTWKAFFKFLKKNPEWKFICIISGEIIKKKDYHSIKLVLHHRDGDKKNDNDLNLFFILSGIHGIINNAQRHWEELADFFEDLIISNYINITEGIVPKSWKIGWRKLAKEKGLRIRSGSYKRRIKTNKKFVKMKEYIKPIDEW